jgi:hypothetical protein
LISIHPEEVYLDNMAAAIYAASHRRVMSMIPAWHTLPRWRRDVFVAVARRAIADIDAAQQAYRSAADAGHGAAV